MHIKIDNICHRIAHSHAVFNFFVSFAAVLFICIEPELWMLGIPIMTALITYFMIRSIGWIIIGYLIRIHD